MNIKGMFGENETCLLTQKFVSPATIAMDPELGKVGIELHDNPSSAPSSASRHDRTINMKLKLSMVVFFVQVFMLVVLITTSIVNISIGREPKELWVALLSTCLGILLPSPVIKGKSTVHSERDFNGL